MRKPKNRSVSAIATPCYSEIFFHELIPRPASLTCFAFLRAFCAAGPTCRCQQERGGAFGKDDITKVYSQNVKDCRANMVAICWNMLEYDVKDFGIVWHILAFDGVWVDEVRWNPTQSSSYASIICNLLLQNDL